LDYLPDISLNCYPNPFSYTASLNFHLEEKDNVDLTLYDMHGNRISTIFSEIILSGGSHTISIDGQNLTNGIYFCLSKQIQIFPV